MSTVSFSRYAALVKNLRGVILVDPSDELTPNYLRWLSRRFRYRVVGLSPIVKEGLRRHGLTPTKQVKSLNYPSEDLALLTKDLSSELSRFSEEVIESAILASAYISPLLVFSDVYVKEVEKLSIHIVKSSIKLNNQLIKLHMRIADYSILDYYDENLSIIEDLWRGVSFEEFVSKREELAVRDSRRYWRLGGEGVKAVKYEPHTFLAYVDLIAKGVGGEGFKHIAESFSFESVGAGLALVPAVVIPKYLIG